MGNKNTKVNIEGEEIVLTPFMMEIMNKKPVLFSELLPYYKDEKVEIKIYLRNNRREIASIDVLENNCRHDAYDFSFADKNFRLSTIVIYKSKFGIETKKRICNPQLICDYNSDYFSRVEEYGTIMRCSYEFLSLLDTHKDVKESGILLELLRYVMDLKDT
jgi:hypothetical protein